MKLIHTVLIINLLYLGADIGLVARSAFNEEDIEILTRFLENQPLGTVPCSAFQELAEQVRPFTTLQHYMTHKLR